MSVYNIVPQKCAFPFFFLDFCFSSISISCSVVEELTKVEEQMTVSAFIADYLCYVEVSG